ncbi:hypothetical protein Clacol_001918 [Clathrus columnatus]|uniref:Uncharacterized protein n=1 Tax=Clathrus columnatus TaxID=1419009 RepID=A0AAV5A2I7_9AGAM|nr:hypothetical protein Clacol_001918 [Clathrus columnatus]
MFWERDPYDRDDIIDQEFHPDHLLPSPSPTYSSEDKTKYDSPYPIPKDSDFPPILYPTQPSYHPFQTELRLYIDLGENLDIRISPTTTWPAPTPTKTYHKDLEDLEIIETLHYARPIIIRGFQGTFRHGRLPRKQIRCQSSKGLIYLTTSRNLHHPSKPHTAISPQPPETQTMFSFNVTTQNISTNSRSSSSYTSQFHYQPPSDSETDDQVPTTCPTTPLPSPIEDLETEVRVYQSSSSQLPIDPDTLWPQYPLMSKDVSTRSKILDLGLPETIKYGDAILIKGFKGQYHINHYFTVSCCAPPYQIIQIIATASLGIAFEHIGDTPWPTHKEGRMDGWMDGWHMAHVKPPRLIVVITGANSGIGYGTCCRLIDQLSYFNPPDANFLPPSKEIQNTISPYAGATELTLIVACRNPKYGQETCESLAEYAKKVCRRRQNNPDEDRGHAEKFYQNLKIEFMRLDLGSMDSVFSFAAEAQRRLPYISHLILNAGSAGLQSIDYPGAIKHFLTKGLIHGVTYPTFFVQGKSSVDEDGLSQIWKVNVFGHFCLYRKLEHLLRASPFEDARVEWTSSLDGFKHFYNFNDVQLLNTFHPYQPSKYQVNLLVAAFTQSEDKRVVKQGEAKLTHAMVHPGICHTNNASALFAFFVQMKVLSFLLARLLGSVNHPISPFKGAVSGTYAALTSRKALRGSIWDPPRMIGSRATIWGSAYVGLNHWECDFDEAEKLKSYCENVYQELPQMTISPLTEDSGVALP